jgi:hypothetical protein
MTGMSRVIGCIIRWQKKTVDHDDYSLSVIKEHQQHVSLLIILAEGFVVNICAFNVHRIDFLHV